MIKVKKEGEERTVLSEYGEIRYTLYIKRVKNVNLRVDQNGEISVSAAKYVRKSFIDDFVISRAGFIKRAADEYKKEKMRSALSAIKDEDMIPIGKKEYRVRVIKAEKDYAFIKGDEFLINLRDISCQALLQKTADRWFLIKAKDAVGKAIEEIYPVFAEMGVKTPKIRFRRMVSQWGNCRNTGGILTFSIYLACVPYECVRYVVSHEFAHFIVPDHSKEFYKTLEKVIPDHKRIREEMKKYKLR